MFRDDNRIATFGGSPKDTLATMLGGFKSAVTSFAWNVLGMAGRIWQGRFYDHVIRNREEFDKIEQYICNNTRNWSGDCFYTR